MTLLEKAEALGASITKVQVDGYPIYRVKCSACAKPGDPYLPKGTNYSSADIKKAMNDHARSHLEQKQVSKTYDDDQRHPSGLTGADVIPDTHDHVDIAKAARGPGHGNTHYIPGDGFLVSHGGFSSESRGRAYDQKVEEIRAKMPEPTFKPMHDQGTYITEEEVLEYAAAIRAHRKMTGAKGVKEKFFEEARARTHAGTDAVDSAKDGMHSQSDAFDIDRSRSTIRIGLTTAGPPGCALNGSKVYHSSFVSIGISSPDGRQLCEVWMSPEQFASALFGNSSQPCTLSRYWSATDHAVMLTERVRPPVSIRKRMKARLKHRLKEQSDALLVVAQELEEQAATGKPMRKTKLNELAERVARAVSHSASNAAFTVDQAREEITSIMESAAIQLIGQQTIDAQTLWDIAGPALDMGDDVKQLEDGKPE